MSPLLMVHLHLRGAELAGLHENADWRDHGQCAAPASVPNPHGEERRTTDRAMTKSVHGGASRTMRPQLGPRPSRRALRGALLRVRSGSVL